MIDFLHLPKPQNGYVDYFPGFSNTTGGSWEVWNKPRGINFINIICIGGGGGGGGGETSTATSRYGAGPGANSSIVNLMMPAIFLPDRLYVSSGTGGSGAAGGGGTGSGGIASYVSIAPSTAAIYCLCNAAAGGGASGGAPIGGGFPIASFSSTMLQSGLGNMTSYSPGQGASTGQPSSVPAGGRGTVGQSATYPLNILTPGAGGGGGFSYAGGSILAQKSATFTLTSITNNVIGAASLTASTTVTEGSNDDGYWDLTLPWEVSFNGTNYSKVYIGTNSYLTFAMGARVYSGNIVASNPPCDKIIIQAGDNSCQRIYYGEEGVAPNRTYRIRYEGTNAATGTLGSPNMVWEATFYENATNQIDIQLGTMARSGGVNGVYSGSQLINSGSSVSFGTANTGVQIVSTNPQENLLFSTIPGGVGGTVSSVVGKDGSAGLNNMELLLFTGGSGGGSGYDGNLGSNGGRGGDGGFGCGGGGGGGGRIGGRGGNGGPGLVIISCW